MSTDKPRIGVIVSSTRKTRFADKPTQWILDLARQHEGWEVELLDLRDFDLPFFDEPASNAWMPTQDPRAVAWQKKLATMDGFIFVVAEYNRSITGALKNALDQAYVEWIRKPMAIVAYGSIGGARAAEHLRTIAVELQMVPSRFGVHIGGGDFFRIHPMGSNAPISEIEASIAAPAKALIDDLDWWARTLKAARAA
jgi:NAD(P)H-dependent FMN reductase